MTSVGKRLNTRNKRREGVKDNSAFLPWATKKEVLVLMRIEKVKKELRYNKGLGVQQIWFYDH